VIRFDRTSTINTLPPSSCVLSTSTEASVLQRLGVNYPTLKSCFHPSVTISRIHSTATTPQILFQKD
jgi:hypothetical protein